MQKASKCICYFMIRWLLLCSHCMIYEFELSTRYETNRGCFELHYFAVVFNGFASCYRYIPLSRSIVPLSTENDTCSCSVPGAGSFPSLSACDEVGKSVSSSLIRCKFGSSDAAAKVSPLKYLLGLCYHEVENLELILLLPFLHNYCWHLLCEFR